MTQSKIHTVKHVWPKQNEKKSSRKKLDLSDWTTSVDYGVTRVGEKLGLDDVKLMCMPPRVLELKEAGIKLSFMLRPDSPSRKGISGTPRRLRKNRKKKTYFDRVMGNANTRMA